MAVGKRTRYEVLKRDRHTCRYCGTTVEHGARLTIDHVMPSALGGSDKPDNLVTACRDCNAGKASVHPGAELVAQVSDDAIRWAAAMSEAAQWARDEREGIKSDIEYFDTVWCRYRTGGQPDGATEPRTPDWQDSIRTFITLGLNIDDLEDLIPIAMRSHADSRWAYYCGCAWNTISNRRDLVHHLIETGQA